MFNYPSYANSKNVVLDKRLLATTVDTKNVYMYLVHWDAYSAHYTKKFISPATQFNKVK